MMEKEYPLLFQSLNEIDDFEVYIKEVVLAIQKIMNSRETFVKNMGDSSMRDAFYQTLYQKLVELTRGEKIHYLGCGHTSLAFQIGDKVLKIGKTDNNYEMRHKKNFQCLIPVFYQDSFQVGEREFYTLQLTPMVDTSFIEEEDVYGTYKNLRDLGYIWNDPTPSNTGRILSDFDYDGRSYKKGDLVIIDLEDIAYVGEDTSDEIMEELSISSYNGKAYLYEERYWREKGKTK